MPDSDRARGLLSEADRAYLRGEREFASTQAERNARARIRDRTFEGVRDFEVLIEGLEDRDRELVFEKRFGELEGPEAFDALIAAVAFLYRGIDDAGLEFETVLREAINLAEASEGRSASVDLDVTFRGLTAEELRRKLRGGESLTLTELAVAQRSEAIDDDELARYLRRDDEPTDAIDDGRIQSKVTDFS